jgi:hypothetical protein
MRLLLVERMTHGSQREEAAEQPLERIAVKVTFQCSRCYECFDPRQHCRRNAFFVDDEQEGYLNLISQAF